MNSRVRTILCLIFVLALSFAYSTSAYAAVSGVVTSPIKDFGQSVSYTTIEWVASTPSGTSVAFEFRAGPDSTPDNTDDNGGIVWPGWAAVSNGGSLSSFSGNRYYQYRVALDSTDDNYNTVPTVTSVTVNTSLPPNLAVLGGATAGDIGLRYDDGAGKKTQAQQLIWDAITANLGQKILFKVRVGDNQAELDANKCYGPGTGVVGSGLDEGCGDWSTVGKYFGQINGQANTSVDVDTAIPLKRYAEVLVRMESAASDTPTLNSVTLSYQVIDAPLNSNLLLKRSDSLALQKSDGTDVTAGVIGGWASTNLRVEATGLTCDGCGSSTNRRIEVEVKPITTAFDETTTIQGTSTDNHDGSFSSIATMANLADATAYHLRVRTIDNEGRVSGWTSYGGNTDGLVDFSVEQTLPTGTIAINSGAPYATSADVTLNISATDTGGSGLGQMRFSNDGSTWSNWEPYNPTKSWTLAVGDGGKKVYTHFRDNAGNIATGANNQINYTAPGSYSHVVPAGVDTITIDIKGGGGGGGGGCFYWEEYQCESSGVSGSLSRLTIGSTQYISYGGSKGGDAYLTGPYTGANGAAGAHGTTNNPSGLSSTTGGGSAGGSGHNAGYDIADGGQGGNGGRLSGNLAVTGGENISVVVGAGGSSAYTSPGANGSVTIAYVVFYVDSITLDTAPPADLTNLRVYTDSGKGTELADSTWNSTPTPYVEWTANVADTAGYKYCFGLSSCVPTNLVTPAQLNNFLTLDLSNQSTYPDGTYYLKVIAFDVAGNESVTPAQFIDKLDRSTPGAVTGYSATQNSDTYIDLSWSQISDPNGSPITYTIEKIFYTKYLEGFTVNDFSSHIWSDQTAYGYEIFTGISGGTYRDNIAVENRGIKYVYRIKATDETGKVGPYQVSPVYGLTRDGISPTTLSNVVAVACSYQTPADCSDSGNDALKGHEITLTWTAGTDAGAGIDSYLVYRSTEYSLLEADYTLVATVTVPNPLPGGYNLTYTDNTNVNDFTFYYYRIVARDASVPPNKSSFVPAMDENYDSVRTPDVTAPTAPVASATAAGLDSSNEHQKTVITWSSATDAGIGVKTYQLFRVLRADVTDLGNTLVDGDFTEITASPSVSCDLGARTCYESGLEDFRYYYYRVKAVDNDPYNNVSAFSATATVKTLSSAVPTPPKGRIDAETRAVEPYPYAITTKGDPTSPSVGHEAKVYFSGSYEKDCVGGVTAPCLVRYDIYRSPDRTAWTKVGEQSPNVVSDDRDSEYTFTDGTVASETLYYYEVRAVGNNPDIEAGGITSSGIGSERNQGWDITPDVTAPSIPAAGLEVKVRDTHPNDVELRNIVTWRMLTGAEVPTRGGSSDFSRYEIWREISNPADDTLLDTSKVAEKTNINENYYMDTIQLDSTVGGIYFIKDCKIRYYIQVVDNAGSDFVYPNTAVLINPSFSNSSAKEYSPDSIIPSKAKPILTAPVTVSNVSVASAEISWATDQDADSIVQFRAFGSTGDWIIDGQVERTTGHVVNLVGLSPNTRYEYQVISRNYLGNNVETWGALPELVTSGFNIIPGTITTTTSTTEINWTTNLDASSAFVEYQLQRSPGDEAQGGTAGVEPAVISSSPRNHKVIVKGLRSARTYTYKVKSISKDGYLSEYPGGEFATFQTKSFDSAQFTLAPASSNVAERNITATTAQIVWQTESPTTSWVDYSTTSGIYDNASGNNDLVGTHVVVIEGLVPGTKYYYRVRVKDANEVEYTSQEYSFTAVLKPKISNMSVKDVTPYSVTISWDTNVDTETIINWGKSAAYGEKRGKSGVSRVHELVVDKLDDNQEYHYQILAKDEAGNEVADADKIVRTPLDTEGPKITGVKIDVLPMGESDTTSSVIVSWTTNKPATTLVEYGEGVIGGTYDKRSVEDLTLNNSHTVIIKGLTPASSYHYRLVSADKRNNKTVSQDYTFVTPSKEKSILQLILKSLEETFSWTKNLNQFFGNIGKRLTGRS